MKFTLAIYYLRRIIEQLKEQRKKYSNEDKEKITEQIWKLERAIIELKNHEK